MYTAIGHFILVIIIGSLMIFNDEENLNGLFLAVSFNSSIVLFFYGLSENNICVLYSLVFALATFIYWVALKERTSFFEIILPYLVIAITLIISLGKWLMEYYMSKQSNDVEGKER